MNFKSLLLYIIISLPSHYLMANDKIVGIWLTQNSDSKVEIYKNGNGSYSGKIIWLKEPQENGEVRIDKNNPKEDMRNRRLIGLIILDGVKYDVSDKEWNNGTIYDPKSGNTYKCYMWFDGSDQKLNVKGNIGFSIMGRTVTWTRVQ